MAIALDTASAGSNTTGTSLTYAHTCTGSNLILFASVRTDTSVDDVTGVTYNAVSMTFVQKVKTTNGRWMYVYMLVAPATGTNNVVVSCTASHYIASQAISYTGAKQSAQPDYSTTDTQDGTGAQSYTKAITTVADNCWVVTFPSGVTGAVTSVTNGTYREGDTLGTYIYDSNGPKTPAGSYSMTVNVQDGNYSTTMLSIAPYVVAAGPTNLKSYNTNLKANIKTINTNLIANVKSLNTNI